MYGDTVKCLGFANHVNTCMVRHAEYTNRMCVQCVDNKIPRKTDCHAQKGFREQRLLEGCLI